MSAYKVLRLLYPALVILSLASCSSAEDISVPTLIPTEKIPTIVAMTVEAQGIRLTADNMKTEDTATKTIPTSTPQPTVQINPSSTPTQNTPTPSPTPMPTQLSLDSPPPANVPPSNVQILSPGPGSMVVSPFILRASIKPDSESVVRIELLGEDGRLLVREVRNYQSLDTDWVNIGSEVSYGTNAVSETGRLQISVEDEHGRLKELSSVDLILLSLGSQDLHHPADQLENIVIESPQANTLIQGDTMRVSGLARPRSTQPLMIEIQSSDGRIVGTRQVAVTFSPGSIYGTFAIDLPFNVDTTNRVRLKVWEPGDIIPGIVDLSSLEVILSP